MWPNSSPEELPDPLCPTCITLALVVGVMVISIVLGKLFAIWNTDSSQQQNEVQDIPLEGSSSDKGKWAKHKFIVGRTGEVSED
jgi:hypothetical protein